MLERPNEEMTQEMVDIFYEKATKEWEEILKDFGCMTSLEFIFSTHQKVAIGYLLNFYQVQEVAKKLGFTLPDLVPEFVIEVIDADTDFGDTESDLSSNRKLH